MRTTMRRPAARWLRGRTGSRVLAGALAAAVLAAAAMVTAPSAADEPWVTSPQEDDDTAGREGAQNHDGGTRQRGGPRG